MSRKAPNPPPDLKKFPKPPPPPPPPKIVEPMKTLIIAFINEGN